MLFICVFFALFPEKGGQGLLTLIAVLGQQTAGTSFSCSAALMLVCMQQACDARKALQG